MQHLPNYYHTFVDVMEFRDVTNEVVTSVATSQFFFDIVSTGTPIDAHLCPPMLCITTLCVMVKKSVPCINFKGRLNHIGN